MRISVVVPVFNATRTLPACLEAMARQEHPDFEVILVDNNSTDGSPAVISNFLAAHPALDAQLFHEPIQSACAARNRGARRASGEIIANIDPDCLPTSTWLSELSAAFADEKVTAVAGNIASRTSENLCELFSSLFTLPGRQQAEEHRAYTLTRGGFATANLALRRSWFEKLGGFDETINYKGVGIGEDHDILARLYQHGGRLLAIPDALVIHWHRANLRGILRQGFLFGMAHALMTRYHGRRGILVSLVGREFLLPGCCRGWVDLEGLDKKVAILLVGAAVHPFIGILLLVFVLLQVRKMAERLRCIRAESPWGVSWPLVGLLFLKSAAMTFGRLKGAVSSQVLCI